MATVHETVTEGSYPVTLKKIGKLYVVVYGHQISQRLNYHEASKEYGLCIMHALQCAGKLD